MFLFSTCWASIELEITLMLHTPKQKEMISHAKKSLPLLIRNGPLQEAPPPITAMSERLGLACLHSETILPDATDPSTEKRSPKYAQNQRWHWQNLAINMQHKQPLETSKGMPNKMKVHARAENMKSAVQTKNAHVNQILYSAAMSY